MTEFERALRNIPPFDFVSGLSTSLERQAARLAPTTVAAGPLIGVLADTHCRQADDLPGEVLEALFGSDLIVHCGDIGDPALLDRLQTVAPVLAVRSAGDVPADGRRLFDGPRLVRAGRVLVGVVAHVEAPFVDLDEIFGTAVDVVLTGTTHKAEIVEADRSTGRPVIVNPGSPTFPASGPASVAVIDANSGVPQARLISIDPGRIE